VGGYSIVESGSSTSRIVTPGAPNGLPRLPPEEPEDRFDLANPSCDGGFELLDEFVPKRRFNSASSASSSAILAACAATSDASSSYDGHCGTASDTPEPCHSNRSPSIKTRRPLKLNTYARSSPTGRLSRWGSGRRWPACYPARASSTCCCTDGLFDERHDRTRRGRSARVILARCRLGFGVTDGMAIESAISDLGNQRVGHFPVALTPEQVDEA
jgi:hypothetical protein